MDEKHCKCSFGSYVQAHEDPIPTNAQHPHTRDTIYLRPTSNGHDVYDLQTKAIINRGRVTPLPIAPSVIKAVEAIAASKKQDGLRIKAANGTTLHDTAWTAGVDYTDSDEEYDSDDDSDYEFDSDEED